MTDSYEELIYYDYQGSKKHPHMSLHDRAAQFSPFAALTGYEDAIHETARLTDEKLVLDEYTKDDMDHKMQLLLLHLSENPRVQFTFFRKDARKEGGTYCTLTGCVKKIDTDHQLLHLTDGNKIAFSDIFSMHSPLFSHCEEETD